MSGVDVGTRLGAGGWLVLAVALGACSDSHSRAGEPHVQPAGPAQQDDATAVVASGGAPAPAFENTPAETPSEPPRSLVPASADDADTDGLIASDAGLTLAPDTDADGGVAAEGTLWASLDVTDCSEGWACGLVLDALYWDADLPPGTSIRFEACESSLAEVECAPELLLELRGGPACEDAASCGPPAFCNARDGRAGSCVSALGTDCVEDRECGLPQDARCSDGRCRGGPSPSYLGNLVNGERRQWRLRAVLVASPDGTAPTLRQWRFTYSCRISV